MANLRRQLTANGAPDAALAAVDPITEGPTEHGKALVVIAHAGGGAARHSFRARRLVPVACSATRGEPLDPNGSDLAGALARMGDDHNPTLVVVSGAVRAVQFLRDQLPARVTDLLAEVQGDYSDLTPGPMKRSGPWLANMDRVPSPPQAPSTTQPAGEGSALLRYR